VLHEGVTEKKNDTDDTVDDTENENSDEEVNYWLD